MSATADPRSLRIDLLTPCFWPEVSRGAERITHELALSLAARGHAPRVVTSHPRVLGGGVENGVRVVRVPRPLDRALRRQGFEDYVTHAPLSYAALRWRGPDLAHAMHGPDALAAVRYRQRTGRPAVFTHMGIPDHLDLFERRRRLEIVKRAVTGSSAVVALSRAARDAFWRWFGHEARLIPPGVNLATFALGDRRAQLPTIICAADVTKPAKRVGLVLEAFGLVRRQRPNALLVLPRPRDPVVAKELAAIEGVRLEEFDDQGVALAAAYGSAWVSVLASIGEAFGLVLVEALACGTPVVATAAGGMPEVVDCPDIGRVAEDDDPTAVARALLEVLALAEDPATRTRCRIHAERFSTERTASAYLALYEELV